MRRDTIFQRSPSLLFELIQPPVEAGRYRFESVEVKKPIFWIDGVFYHRLTQRPALSFLLPVQLQKEPY